MSPLLEDKGKFREWNAKFINAMDQVDAKYGEAMAALMKRFFEASALSCFLMAGREDPARSLRAAMAPQTCSRYVIVVVVVCCVDCKTFV